MKEFIIEKDFVVEGYRCVIVGNALGYRCGYVEIPSGHCLYEKDYYDINIEVHGGWTYADINTDGYPVVTKKQSWWIGFDCGHCYDGIDLELIKKCGRVVDLNYLKAVSNSNNKNCKTIGYVENELRNAVKQIKALE